MELDLSSRRAARARTALTLRRFGARWLAHAGIVLAVIAAAVWFADGPERFVYTCLALASSASAIGLWYKRGLANPPPRLPAANIADFLEPDLLASLRKSTAVTPRGAWAAASPDWRGRFVLNHLMLPDQAGQILPDTASDMNAVWRSAADLMKRHNDAELHAGTLVAALLTSSQAAKDALAKLNLKPDDVLEVSGWLSRLSRSLAEPRPYFGGIGRDWASGFTPTLDQFGQNISAAVEAGRGHFHTLAHGDVLDSLVHSLGQPQGNAALVGPAGTGKTSLVYALAERLLSGKDQKMQYYQIISLNASAILSAAGDKLEKIMLTLFNEAAHARNIVIFLDEAELFFGKGAGAFDVG